MRRSLRALTITTAALATFGTAGAALAATPSAAPSAPAGRLAAIQAAGAKATSDRIIALDGAIPKVTANVALSAADKSTILNTLNADLNAMHALAAKIAADSTADQASTDYKSIFSTYRVFAVALPQSAYAAAADDLTDTTVPKLTAAQKSLAALLAGPDAAKSTPALQAQLADMAAKIAAAQSAVSGVAASALGVTPAGYDANHSILVPIRQSETTALADAKAAGVDASDIVAALK
jgi:hypothetical protein